MINWFRIAMAAALVAVLVGGAIYVRNEIRQAAIEETDEKWQKLVDKQKAEAADLLAKETARANAAEGSLKDALLVQERKDAENVQSIAALQSAIRLSRARAGAAGRMLDPNATGCRSGGELAKTENSTTSNGGGKDNAQADKLLSVQLTDLLDRLMFEADEQSTAYASCRADGESLRATLKQWSEGAWQ